MFTATVFVELLNEGTQVWRPVAAEQFGENLYRLLEGPPQDGDEEWAFPANSVVVGTMRSFSDGTAGIVAVKLASLPPR